MNTDTTPRVSIVLPVYNGEKYLREAIDSVIAQTYPSWELLIVNDCSTDSTRSIAEDYARADSRIRVLNNAENMKVPKSLNYGFSEARGEFLSWTSDDNVLLPEMLEKLVAELDLHPEFGMVYSNMFLIDGNGDIISDSFFGNQTETDVYKGCGGSFLYRASVAAIVGGYDPEVYLVEDYDYWFRMYAKTRIGYVPEKLYKFRQHGENQTATKADRVKELTLQVLWKNYWPVINSSESFGERRKLYNRVLRFCDTAEKRKYYKVIMEMFIWMIKSIVCGIFSK